MLHVYEYQLPKEAHGMEVLKVIVDQEKMVVIADDDKRIVVKGFHK